MKKIKRGHRGAPVRSLQNKLIQLNFDVGNARADGVFGLATENAVKAFQRSVNIVVDGIVGNDTMTMLNQVLELPRPERPAEAVPSDRRLARLVIQTALSQVGVREQPINSNRGREVEQYLASIGLGGGYAWCMAFVFWCTKEAAKQLKLPNPLYKTGGVLMQWNQRPQLRITQPAPGDIFIMDKGQGRGHAGFVEALSGQTIHTIEGNSNEAGSAEGDGVYQRTREISLINKGFLRL